MHVAPKTNLKPSLNLDYLDGPVKAPKWKNLYFLKSGASSMRGEYDSELLAKNAVNEWEKRCAEIFKYHGNDSIPNTTWTWLDYSHTIQIPWGKE